MRYRRTWQALPARQRSFPSPVDTPADSTAKSPMKRPIKTPKKLPAEPTKSPKEIPESPNEIDPTEIISKEAILSQSETEYQTETPLETQTEPSSDFLEDQTNILVDSTEPSIDDEIEYTGTTLPTNLADTINFQEDSDFGPKRSPRSAQVGALDTLANIAGGLEGKYALGKCKWNI